LKPKKKNKNKRGVELKAPPRRIKEIQQEQKSTTRNTHS